MHRSPFIGFDMLAEPKSQWPAWLDRWIERERRDSLGVFGRAFEDELRSAQADYRRLVSRQGPYIA